MPSVLTGMPVVEVTAPDGSKSLWAAAVAPSGAVRAVNKMIPPDHVAKLLDQRLPIIPQTEGMRRGDVRKVELNQLAKSIRPEAIRRLGLG